MDQTYDQTVTMPMARIRYWSGLGVIVLVILFFAQTAYWWWWPYNIMTINKLTVLSVSHENGLVLSMDYCRSDSYDNLKATVRYSFANKMNYNVPVKTEGPLRSGCHVVQEEIEIPVLPPGIYHLEMRREYQVNPVRVIAITAESNDFTIQPRLETEIVVPVMAELVKANEKLIKQNEELIRENGLLLKRIK